MRRLIFGLFAIGLVGLPVLPATANEAPEGSINAALSPPNTQYTASVSDPDGDTLTFAWSASIGCGTFTPGSPTASQANWNHPEGDPPTGCPHDQGTSHPGTITVVVSDGHGNEVKCSYQGSLSGEGAPCVKTKCPIMNVEGWFEPTQGVWQDDTTFGDAEGRQLIKESPVKYHAELPMVVDRRSLLFGIDHAAGEAPGSHDRFEIVIKGKTTGSIGVPVKMRFTSDQTMPNEIFMSSVLTTLPLDPPCEEVPEEFEIKLPAAKGIPTAGSFSFLGAGGYTIKGELIREDTGAGTGAAVDVSGMVLKTRGPNTRFVPLLISGASAEEKNALKAAAEKLAGQARKHIPDYYPLKRNDLPVEVDGVTSLTKSVEEEQAEWIRWLRELIPPDEAGIKDQVRLSLVDKFLKMVVLDGKAERVVVVMRAGDVAKLAGRVNAFTLSNKVIVVKDAVNQFTIGHEMAHTMPYLWNGLAEPECGIIYHNRKRTPVANGFQISSGGSTLKELKDGSFSIMGGPDAADRWVDQCTYAHLAEQLQSPPDPEVILVEGRIARSGDAAIGEILATERREGFTDLEAAEGGDWAIVLRDASGVALARYPFEPVWKLSDTNVERKVLYVAYRVPDLIDATSVDLEGPGGLLHSSTL